MPASERIPRIAPQARRLYRIVKANPPTTDDFLTARDSGRPLRQPAYEREWSQAVSMYDDEQAAAAKTRLFGFRLGSFLAIIDIPADSGIEVRRTMDDAHHYSVYADAASLLSLVVSVVILEREA